MQKLSRRKHIKFRRYEYKEDLIEMEDRWRPLSIYLI
jgi:hypothetical protein